MNFKALFSVYIAYLLNFVYSPSGPKKGPISTFLTYVFAVIQSLSHVQLFVTPWTAARQASMSFTVSQSSLKLMSIQSGMPSNLRWLDEIPLSLSSLPVPGLSQWDSSSHQVTEVLEFQLQHQSFQWVFSVDSFRINWFDLLALQGTLKSFLQHHSSEVSILLYESESEVTQLCLTLCHPVDCSLPGSSVHGILQARILEWVVISFSRGSSRLRNPTWVSRIVGRRFNLWATREALWCSSVYLLLKRFLDRPQPWQTFANMYIQFQFSCSLVWLFVTPWTAAGQASLFITNSRSLLKLMSIESVMPSNRLILCHPFSCVQSFSASGSFPLSQLFASGGQSIGVSASASVLPMNIQDWFPLRWTDLISLQSKGLSSENESESCSVMSNSFRPHGLYSPWDSLGQNTGVGSLSLLQRIFPTQVSQIAGRFFTSWATRDAFTFSFLTSTHDYWKNYSFD